MSDCSNCGSANTPEARFCANCGTSLAEAPSRCASCNAALPEEARFCPACATPVPGASQASGRERRVVTLLFADVTGSTSLGEKLDPERLREVLDTYFAAMRDEIEAEGGTIEKYIGDAVVAAFGIPAAHEDDPSRAIRAALRMQRRMPTVNRDLVADHDVSLQIRIGVNTGEVLATIDPAPGEPMFTGDAVNVAARFEQAADPGQVVTSERTARWARGFRYRELGQLELKGKASAVRAFAVEGEGPGLERGVPGLSAPMVGRASELSMLQSAYDNGAAEGRPSLITIYGDAGVGKSRLTAEFIDWASSQEPSPTIVRGRCLPYGEGVTYWPLAEILKGLAGVQDSDSPSLALEKIRAAGQRLITDDMATDPRRATALLAYTVGVDDPSFAIAQLDPRQFRAEMRAAWRSLFTALAVPGPVVAVIDDIHWADPALLDLLEDTADVIRAGVLFVCPSRPDLLARRPAWGGGKRSFSSIALEPLTEAESDVLVTHLLAVEDLPETMHRRILERAEGNPFFLEEIVRQLIDLGQIVRSGQRWRAVGGIEEMEIPDTVQGVLAARIDLLGAEEKRTLQSAAVVGRIFWPGPVIELLGGQDSELYDVLGRLEARELVLERLGSAIAGELEYIFKHVLTRDVAYESLPRRERSQAHAAVASWIERTAGQRRSEFVELLAYHWEEAYRGLLESPHGDLDRLEELRRKALDALCAAAADARGRSAFDAGLNLADRALALADGALERAETLELKGTIAISDYRGDLGWASFSEAVEVRRSELPHDRAALAWACAKAVEIPTRWPGSMAGVTSQQIVSEYLELGFANVPEGDNETRQRLLTFRAFAPLSVSTSWNDEDPRISDELGLEAVAMGDRMGRSDLVSAALDAAGSAPLVKGDYGSLLPMVERRLELADDLSDGLETGDAYAMAAWTLSMIGDYPRAIELATAGADRTANTWSGAAIHCLSWRAISEFLAGHWATTTEETMPRIQSLLGDRKDDPPYFSLQSFAATAAILESQGKSAAAQPLLASVKKGIKELEANFSDKPQWMLALVDLQAGRQEEVWESLGAQDTGEKTDTGRPLLDIVRAQLIADLGKWDLVPAFLERSRAFAQVSGLSALPLHLDRLQARAWLNSGDLDAAGSLMSATRDGFARLGSVWERARTERLLAEALLASGNRDGAREALAAATEVFEKLGAIKELRSAAELM